MPLINLSNENAGIRTLVQGEKQVCYLCALQPTPTQKDIYWEPLIYFSNKPQRIADSSERTQILFCCCRCCRCCRRVGHKFSKKGYRTSESEYPHFLFRQDISALKSVLSHSHYSLCPFLSLCSSQCFSLCLSLWSSLCFSLCLSLSLFFSRWEWPKSILLSNFICFMSFPSQSEFLFYFLVDYSSMLSKYSFLWFLCFFVIYSFMFPNYSSKFFNYWVLWFLFGFLVVYSSMFSY